MNSRRHSRDIISDAAKIYGVPETHILGRDRRPRTVEARWAVMASLDDLGWSSCRIAQRLNKHHTTVLHGLGRLGDGR